MLGGAYEGPAGIDWWLAPRERRHYRFRFGCSIVSAIAI